ncbi:UDP-N-acetylglucosamine--N-acetylmuramyl-(pentapeptide) pyrophosphoryl-undecaprenol N-acetylglucosamine transferase [hydrothermal vent metagenome]|uniref:UDP-N-acetylglucosamine--N-acetylmuramyl-(Pentapeptide) pyrophosphoryl-undecaprenol N-acetylglucosamine transferase n=1 Tax=hydrothermal vent metagenome TaxID=652676 RepID=A0A1W1EKX1_9ZZZZ
MIKSREVIIFTGGGTGGHLSIVKAVKSKLSDYRIVYIGSQHGQDKEWFENDPDFFRKYFLDTMGVFNQNFFGKIRSIALFLNATKEAVEILKELNPKVVFSVGGYSSAPVAYAAKFLKIPLVIHEQNAVTGRLNAKLESYATHFISSYRDDSPIKEYPIKEEFFIKKRVRDKIKCIFFIGGSQGAVAINKLALSLAEDLNSRGIKIIHQAGNNNVDEVKKEYEALGIHAKVFGYSNNISSYMNEADIAISRAGASTLWELSANGLPAIFIPYPHAIGDHQYHNAKFLEEQDLAWIIREEDIDNEDILDIIDAGDISKKSKALSKIIDSTGDIRIAQLLKGFLD